MEAMELRRNKRTCDQMIAGTPRRPSLGYELLASWRGSHLLAGMRVCALLCVAAGCLSAAHYEPLKLDLQNPHYLNFPG
jgi:hypothetical protein